MKHQCIEHGEVGFCDGCLVDSLHYEIAQLKSKLNNMEACYIEKKKEVEDQQKRINETITQVNKYRNIGLPMLNPLLDDIEKALRGEHE